MPTSASETGSVRSDEMLPLDTVKSRLGLGKAAIRTARANGLLVRRIGRRSFVLGADLLAYTKKRGRVVR